MAHGWSTLTFGRGIMPSVQMPSEGVVMRETTKMSPSLKRLQPHDFLLRGSILSLSVSVDYATFSSKITDTNLTQTTAFLEFSPNTQYADTTVGGVINTFPDGRSQMAFFCSFVTWSPTSAYLNYIRIHRAAHGLYDDYRRVLLGAQIDDVLLGAEAWDTSITYCTTVTDMVVHADRVNDVNNRFAKANPGFHYIVEPGLNGNGNLLQSYDQMSLKSLTGTCQDPI